MQVKPSLSESLLLIKEINGRACHNAFVEWTAHVVNRNTYQRDHCEVTVSDRDYDFLVDFECLLNGGIKLRLKRLPVEAEFNNHKELLGRKEDLARLQVILSTCSSDITLPRQRLSSSSYTFRCSRSLRILELEQRIFSRDVVELAYLPERILVYCKKCFLVFFWCEESEHIVDVTEMFNINRELSLYVPCSHKHAFI